MFWKTDPDDLTLRRRGDGQHGRPAQPLSDDPSTRISSANVYIGARSRSPTASLQGADIVIGGRITDPALVAGPLMYEFGWSDDRIR